MKEASTWYYCNCCGCTFLGVECESDSGDDEVKCPECGAPYRGEDGNGYSYVIKKNK